MTRAKLLTPAKAAEILGITVGHVYALNRKGDLPGELTPQRTWGFKASKVRTLARQRKKSDNH